ncbi:MAG TPA: translation initiation factor IF-2 [Saprospiraceae bacterium]|nr:translation initiation factor IF-2 [Saprospiraceae bacterium]
MAKRNLVKTASELNVATTTIVNFLTENSFDITNKPNAKISDEMYAALVQKFQGSIAEKQEADNLVIGTRPAQKPVEEAPAEKVEPIVDQPTPKVEPVKEEVPAPKPEPKSEPKPEPKPKEPETTDEDNIIERPQLRKPKILGKIDLDKPKKVTKKSEPKPEEPKPEEPKPAPKTEPKVEAQPEAKPEPVAEKPEVKQEEPPASAPQPTEQPTEKKEEDTFIKHKTPTLKGLKILGKIDTSKLDKKRSTDKKKTPRKRTVKKVVKPKQGQTSGGGGGRRNDNRKNQSNNRRNTGRKNEVKEVSQQEIDKQLKATMAKLNSGASKKRQKRRRDIREKKSEIAELQEMEATNLGKIAVTEFISVSEFASLLDVTPVEIISACFSLGVVVSINQRMDAEIIELVATEFDREVEFISAEEQLDLSVDDYEDDEEDLLPRAPIVTIMGHVDHGKTSLLDYIRSAKVAHGEAGGITQHIGAYEVNVGDSKVTFLDTPGHEAFTAMRARGAKVTDIAIIIISADDRVMPQTKEAISHAQAAGVPMIFAINKIDKEGANPELIKKDLAAMNLLVEEWGGEYLSEDISAKTGLNVDKLLEKILLQAEVMELKANPNRPARGSVIEASLEKGKGFVAKMLVQKGTLSIGDSIVAGEYFGRVKAIVNDLGKRVKSAGPSTPVMVLGLDGAPAAGEVFKEVESDSDARQIASKVAQIKREQSNRAQRRISLEEIGRRLALGSFKELNLIVKGDVDGSVEALSDSLIKLGVETIQVNVIHKAVGQIFESDVLLASASDAIIIGFQVRPSAAARALAEAEKVEIKTYSVIYEAIDDVKAAMEGLLEPKEEEEVIGYVEVREVYSISRIGKIAGCYVQSGKITRNSKIRVIRDGVVIYPTKQGIVGELASLKRFKDDAKEVKNGMECGLSIKNFNDIKVGDEIEAYIVNEVQQTLD